jgi:RHS repeat-associated protein
MFDAKGRPVKVEGSKLFPLELVYDATGRVVSKNYGGRNQSFSYNSQGRLASVTNALGQTSRYSYDNAGRIFQIQKPDGRLLKFTFDENDNLRSLIQPKNQTYSFAFDELNQTVLDTDPAVAGLNREWSYNYDSDRMRIRDQFPNGQNVEYRYDNYGRMISTETLLGSYKYNYDSATSQVVGVTTPENNSLTYGWDGNLQTSVKWAGKVNGLLTRNYETQMRLHSENVMNVVEIPYSYTAEGSLASAGGLNLSYDSLNGFLLESTLLGTVERLTYSDFGELASRKVSLDNIEIYREVFIRDALGGISQISRSEQGVNESLTYSYDSTGRLIVAKNGTTTESFTYDANDNRILDTQTSYDDQDRLVHNKDFTFTYDARGHMSSKTARNTNAKTIYEYDNFGQLLSIKDNTGLNLSYVYDGEGRQVARLKNGIVTRALLYRDRLNPVAELEANGTLKSVFVYGSRRNVPEYMDRGGVIFRFVADHLGSVRMVVNLHTKVVVQRITYDAWGRVLSDSNPGFQPFGFAGGIYDIDSKLVRFGARDYDSVTGRWIDKDPIKFNGGANFYSYVNADPVNKIDPSGLVCEYSQGTGQMNCVNELGPYYTETGYAGKGVGKNNPTMENVENFGPTPRGAYTTGELFKHIPAGKNTRRLYPDAATADRIKSMGRDPKTFMMHGDKSTNPGNASEGCIVLSPARTIIPTGELIIVKE